MSGWVHGSTLKGSEIRFLSASSIQKGDATTSSGCPRRWVYDYRFKIKEPPSKRMEDGTRLHAEIEHYLKTGDRSQLSSIALRGLHTLPDASDPSVRARLLVEHSLVPTDPNTGQESLALAPLRVLGIPLLGKIDLMHNLGLNYGTEDFAEQQDPEGTIEVSDQKTTGNIKNAKSKNELLDLVQMVSYGEYVFTVAPDTKFVRLSHHYFPDSGQGKKVTVRVDREALQPTWRRVHAVVAGLKDAAAEPDVNKIEANTRACKAYGRLCPAADRCEAYKRNSVASIVGVTGAERILAQIGGSAPNSGALTGSAPAPRVRLPVFGSDISEANAPNACSSGMNNTPTLLQQLQASVAQQPAAAPVIGLVVPVAAAAPSALFSASASIGTLVVPVASPAPPAPPAPPATVASEIQRLEAALPAKPVAPPPAPASSPAPSPADIHAELAAVEAHGLGRPTITGDLAVQVALAGGQSVALGTTFPGLGKLGEFTASTEAELRQVLGRLQELAAASGVQWAGHAPHLQAQVASETAAAAPAPVPTALAVPAAAIAEPAPAEAPKKRVGRPKKDAAAAATTPVADTAPATPVPGEAPPIVNVHVIAPAPTAEPAPSPAPVANSNVAVNLYVDCIVDGLQTASLWPLVHEYEEILNREAGQSANPPVHTMPFKASEKFGFGKGEQMLGIMLREAHTRGRLTPGNYTLDGVGSSLGQAAVEALRDVVHKTSGVFVRGARS